MLLNNYRALLVSALVIFFSFSATKAFSHQMSTGYLYLKVDKEQSQVLNGQIQLRWFDLDRELIIDSNWDGNLEWNEVQQKQIAISEFILNHLSITTENGSQSSQQCALTFSDKMKIDTHFDEGYLAYDFVASCPEPFVDTSLTINYSGIFTLDSDHKLVVTMQGLNGHSGSLSGLIEAQQQSIKFNSAQSSWFSTLTTFVYQGVVHILIGTDHILFIIVLVLTCALYRSNKTWQPKSNFIKVMKSTAWVITAFTLAHSITLTATALGWLAPSSKWVEFGIALSVLFTALNNIWPVVLRLGWITFAFGLLHGMGFASVLGELGLAKEHTLLSIVSFNIGVELGQLAILALAIPLLFFVRKQKWYQTYGVNIGSLIIAIVAVNWCIERL